MKINSNKNRVMLVGNIEKELNIEINGKKLKLVNLFRYLGLKVLEGWNKRKNKSHIEKQFYWELVYWLIWAPI